MTKRYIDTDMYLMMQTKIAAQIHVSEYLDTESDEESAGRAKELTDAILKLNEIEVIK